jgi:hypothetical protein
MFFNAMICAEKLLGVVKEDVFLATLPLFHNVCWSKAPARTLASSR